MRPAGLFATRLNAQLICRYGVKQSLKSSQAGPVPGRQGIGLPPQNEALLTGRPAEQESRQSGYPRRPDCTVFETGTS